LKAIDEQAGTSVPLVSPLPQEIVALTTQIIAEMGPKMYSVMYQISTLKLKISRIDEIQSVFSSNNPEGANHSDMQNLMESIDAELAQIIRQIKELYVKTGPNINRKIPHIDIVKRSLMEGILAYGTSEKQHLDQVRRCAISNTAPKVVEIIIGVESDNSVKSMEANSSDGDPYNASAELGGGYDDIQQIEKRVQALTTLFRDLTYEGCATQGPEASGEAANRSFIRSVCSIALFLVALIIQLSWDCEWYGISDNMVGIQGWIFLYAGDKLHTTITKWDNLNKNSKIFSPVEMVVNGTCCVYCGPNLRACFIIGFVSGMVVEWTERRYNVRTI